MVVAEALGPSHLQVAGGRRLKLAPRWDDDAGLCFDAASGDYWVLTVAACDLVRSLIAGEAPTGADSATIESLIAAGLLERVDAEGA